MRRATNKRAGFNGPVQHLVRHLDREINAGADAAGRYLVSGRNMFVIPGSDFSQRGWLAGLAANSLGKIQIVIGQGGGRSTL
ncbi:hypothetical protein ACVIRM_005066 [Rhizobium laguerreae]